MKILINTTTFPNSPGSPVPAFVLDQVKAIYALDNSLEIDVLIPHHAYEAALPDIRVCKTHREIRYHYFWPRRFEKLTGRGILPALKQNPLRVGLIPFHLFFQYRALRKLCRHHKPDLVYAHWFMSPAIISYYVCKAFKIPLVFTTHASDVSVLKKVPFSKKLIENILEYCIAYTAVSQRTKTRLTGFFSSEDWSEKFEEKMSIIPMGTNLDIECPDEALSSNLLRSVGIKGTVKFILAMGRLAEKKGLEDLIEAYGNLPPHLQNDYALVVAGEGQSGPALRAQANDMQHQGEIIFPGYASGPLKSALLSKCSVFAMPSIIDSKGDSEGLPVTLMEALAHERIVIATNVSGAEEILTEEAGYLVEQKSPPELSIALKQSLTLPTAQKAKMQSEARQLSLQFGWPEIAEKHLLVLRAATRK